MTGAVAVSVGLSTSFTVTASPDFVEAVAPAVTGFVTATPQGGFAPYTYLWTRQSGAGTALSPTSASTRFSESSGTWVCVVTDSAGRAANSNTVSVEIS